MGIRDWAQKCSNPKLKNISLQGSKPWLSIVINKVELKNILKPASIPIESNFMNLWFGLDIRTLKRSLDYSNVQPRWRFMVSRTTLFNMVAPNHMWLFIKHTKYHWSELRYECSILTGF